MSFTIVYLIVFTFISSLAGQFLGLIPIFIIVLFDNSRNKIFKSFKKFSILIIFTLLIHLFFRFDPNNYFNDLLSKDLWIKSLFFTIRNVNIILLMIWFINSMSKIDYYSSLNSLQKKFLKFKINLSFLIQPLIIGLRYFDIIHTELKSLQQIHRIMGMKKPTKITKKIKYYSGLILPLIINSIERAEILSIALTTRKYNYSTKDNL
ncbi:MAG: energy-coupling factor transporter transmembrane component T [Candidatus Marinimicrobia bacterium]|nr:energy-coupling factor transporter transmembrane component T [Candidatus Neomarinimicrobiota bacterium]